MLVVVVARPGWYGWALTRRMDEWSNRWLLHCLSITGLDLYNENEATKRRQPSKPQYAAVHWGR